MSLFGAGREDSIVFQAHCCWGVLLELAYDEPRRAQQLVNGAAEDEDPVDVGQTSPLHLGQRTGLLGLANSLRNRSRMHRSRAYRTNFPKWSLLRQRGQQVLEHQRGVIIGFQGSVPIMIKHMVVFRFKPDTPADVQAELLQSMGELPKYFPAMKRFGLGVNVSERDQKYSHAMTMEFDTIEELKAYLNSDYHEGSTATRFRPVVQERAIVSYELV